METIVLNKHNMVKSPTNRRQASWLFTNIAEGLNLG